MHSSDALKIYLGSIWSGIFLATVLIASPLDSTKVWKPSPTGAAIRSLILPGWGQAYNRQPLKAVIYGGLEEGLIYGIYRQHQLFQVSRQAGDQAGADFYRNDRNRLTWYLTGTVILSMIDAYVDAHLFDFDVSPQLSSIEIQLGKQDEALNESQTGMPVFCSTPRRADIQLSGINLNTNPSLRGIKVKIGWLWR